MKKLLLSFAAMASIVLSSNAKTVLPVESAYFWGNGTKEGNVVTFTKEWDGLAWWLGEATGYVKCEVTYAEPTPMLTQLLTQWNDISDAAVQAPAGSLTLTMDLPEGSLKQLAIQNAAPGVMVVESVVLYTAADLAVEPEGPATNKCVAVTLAEAKANPWDNQIFINFDKPLEKGKSYALKMDIKGSEPFEGKIGENGLEAIQPVMQDDASSNRDQWGGPADLQYMAHFSVPADWATIADNNDNDIMSDGKFPYNRVLLNLGSYKGTLYIDNFRIVDAEGVDYISYDFNTADQFAKVVSGWMNVPLAHVVSDCPTAIESVKAEQNYNRIYNLAGQQMQAAKGLCIMNGKVILVK